MSPTDGVALGNKGGVITLLDPQGLKVHGVSYTTEQAREEAEQSRIRDYWGRLAEADRERLTREALASTRLAFLVKRYRAQKDPELSARTLKTILDGYILELLDDRPGR